MRQFVKRIALIVLIAQATTAFAPSQTTGTRWKLALQSAPSDSDNEASSSPPPPTTDQTPDETFDRPLDPLVVALTKIDKQTAAADSVSIPVVGEFVLDKSLFVVLPIAAFGLIGILTSLYILLNSSDVSMEAINIQTAPESTASCRGLCQADMTGLENFMKQLQR